MPCPRNYPECHAFYMGIKSYWDNSILIVVALIDSSIFYILPVDTIHWILKLERLDPSFRIAATLYFNNINSCLSHKVVLIELFALPRTYFWTPSLNISSSVVKSSMIFITLRHVIWRGHDYITGIVTREQRTDTWISSGSHIIRKPFFR